MNKCINNKKEIIIIKQNVILKKRNFVCID
jgi:hypothetical protein